MKLIIENLGGIVYAYKRTRQAKHALKHLNSVPGNLLDDCCQLGSQLREGEYFEFELTKKSKRKNKW